MWYIPLNDGTISVGVVVNEEQNKIKRKALREDNPDSTLRDYYLSQVKLAPTIGRMLDNAVFVSSTIKSASDYSYSATVKSGPGFRLVGDAAGRFPLDISYHHSQNRQRSLTHSSLPESILH